MYFLVFSVVFVRLHRLFLISFCWLVGCCLLKSLECRLMIAIVLIFHVFFSLNISICTFSCMASIAWGSNRETENKNKMETTTTKTIACCAFYFTNSTFKCVLKLCANQAENLEKIVFISMPTKKNPVIVADVVVAAVVVVVVVIFFRRTYFPKNNKSVHDIYCFFKS